MRNVQEAIEHIYPLVNEFRKERTAEDIRTMQATKRSRHGIRRKYLEADLDEECIDLEDSEDDDIEEMEEDLDGCDSDDSHN